MLTAHPEFLLKRITLRKILPSHLVDVYRALSNPKVIAHYGVSYSSLTETEEQMRWFERIVAEKSGIWWGISFINHESLIGACGFNDVCHEHRKAQIGYWLMPEYWRQGLLSEALPSMIDYGFSTLRLHPIHAEVEPENESSCALLRKFGFQREGTLRDVEFKDGAFLSLHQYGLLSTDIRERLDGTRSK
ncbi:MULTISPECIES: GNAT family N-acetyltransferase [unclassified Pseudomonas]|uniref:GNAT family N-acetyltransferase n=1 Tax=unclassified Pseudomonas TaxID=196821 RepID=UPI000BD0D41C|nr:MULTISPECIES: GNAT family protein [unclassified Pseudomonas]PVZ19879.1 ribosomal-protein-alanine N-acetyltransferase [Pseudomonas sp. URIL14HWK12:I12]PVZ26945.1 ribosomal-protein-alanine N-acetyltransferase [Pseudomonas sp. URIL14HWK12:I10]PVZ37834.1 ribosomal-protein-alanine N-acetyltransferase [Pseudomonas sp. URIL14HWK12:I11]SNZ05482.1 ribosomal-protein-alanine N-acetyltransferase [Pseudomonas sp. URIL14HWK12:I9]